MVNRSGCLHLPRALISHHQTPFLPSSLPFCLSPPSQQSARCPQTQKSRDPDAAVLQQSKRSAAIVSTPPRVPPHHAATRRLPNSPNHPSSSAAPTRHHRGHAGNFPPIACWLSLPPGSPPLLSAHARPPPGPCAVQCYSLHLRTCRRHHTSTTHYPRIGTWKGKLRRSSLLVLG